MVKVYEDSDYNDSLVSYWPPKNTTKTLASAVFRYYRQNFSNRPTFSVKNPFVFWAALRDTGDGRNVGNVVENHWEPIAKRFNRSESKGKLAKERCVDEFADEDSDDSDELDSIGGARPYVFKLCLGSLPPSPPNSSKSPNPLSRLDVLKQMFDAYINRLLAYNFRTHVGLVTFSTKASLSQKITYAVEDFRHRLNRMTAAGHTAVWDSIALAQDQLQEYAKQYPGTKLRICISDGEDNKSRHTAQGLASDLIRSNIVIDSFFLGNAFRNRDLKTISYLTGGYVFEPDSLEETMAICELEPVLSLSDRPEESVGMSGVRSRFLANPSVYTFSRARDMVHVEKVSCDEFPGRKQLPQLAESFVELGRFRTTSTNRTDSNVRLSRTHNEIRNSGAKPHPHYDVYICESNMGL